MTINDQIRDEKQQYDVNREAAKISSKSLGKLRKYEYLTGEDILPSNQQQIIEQARFTYSPLGKAFEKHIKTMEDQGKKQDDALKGLKTKEQTKTITYNVEENCNKLFDEKFDELQVLSREIDYKILNYNFTTKDSGSINFIKFQGPFSLFKKIRDRDRSLEMAEENQEKFKRELGQIKSGNPKHKSEMLLYTLKNIKNLYGSRQKIVDLFNNYSKIKSQSIYRSKHGEN